MSSTSSAKTQFIDIGGGNLVSCGRIIAVVSPDSAPIKRMVAEARESGGLIDATTGRATKSVIFADSGHVVLSYATPQTLQKRIAEAEK